MKLVDILARELKTWPEGVQCLTQSTVDREIYDALDGQPESSVESLNPRFDTIDSHTEAAYPIVTRAQWQAAVDALTAEECAHSYANKLGCPECGEDFKPAWTGEGLPPVGTVCEYDARSVGKGDPLWVTVKINYLSEWTIVFECIAVPTGTKQENVGVELSACADVGTMKRFRLPRTPAQIADEKREKAITDIALVMGKDPDRPFIRERAAVLYDAGYRKVEVKP